MRSRFSTIFYLKRQVVKKDDTVPIMDRDNFVTAKKVKNAFLGLEHRCHTLMKIYEQFTADYAKMVEAGMKSKKELIPMFLSSAQLGKGGFC